MDLSSTEVGVLPGVGPALSKRLAKLGVRTVQDLLFHLPLRYEDRGTLRPIGTLRPGERVAVEGNIDITQVKFGRRRSLLCRISDGTGALLLRFFHFSNAQQQGLARGATIRCFGEVRKGPGGAEMVHPEYKFVSAGGDEPDERATLTSVYPSSEGLRQPNLRRLTAAALKLLAQQPLTDHLPTKMREQHQLVELNMAVQQVHRPTMQQDMAALNERRHATQERLAFEELLAHQLSMRHLRQQARAEMAPDLAGRGTLRQRFLQQLPFTLTNAQQRVAAEIATDLNRTVPMLRLVQGDVGSGKTVVAMLALLQAVECGHQGALMAPTELLAAQHFENLRVWCEPLGINIAWLSGKLTAKARREAIADIASGTATIAVGTHALFQKEVEFAKLALIVVDEQHRFGVHQRLALREKGATGGGSPHQLVMTATPIPRTLAQTAYADLDCSIIDELPPGRQEIKTVVLGDSRRDEVIERARRGCAEGRQAYWVCPLIEESEKLQCQAASDTAQRLAEELPELRVGLLHGRVAMDERTATMRAFKQGEIDLLVATTVIEVGVDVPNASLMIIENAERLGLAQLHQLRGRVGRGSARSHCVLLYQPPLGGDARQRLTVMREHNDGFEIARHDLAIRGPGELLGARQSGALNFRIADLAQHQHWIEPAQRMADVLLQQHPQAAQALIRRWMGETEQYARA
jgi:ATP-dependent DNA helicase RecG